MQVKVGFKHFIIEINLRMLQFGWFLKEVKLIVYTKITLLHFWPSLYVHTTFALFCSTLPVDI